MGFVPTALASPSPAPASPYDLLKLLLFGVVIVSVNDDHTIDHIVVKFKAVTQFDVTSSLNSTVA